MKRFHIHLYFSPDQIVAARALADKARSTEFFDFVQVHEVPMGPHPLGAVEGHFSELFYTSVLEWVDAHRGTFSALIHLDTGDDVKDHSEGTRWLGEELPLNFDFFELIKSHPELRIHP